VRTRTARRRARHQQIAFSGNGGINLLTNKLGIGAVGLGVLGMLAVAACGSTSGGTTTGALASSQVLHFPIDTELMQNVFDNLWRFDDNLNIVPDIALTVPTQANGGISADGTTFTIHLNPAARFSNGDPVTSKDVLYSWNRAADLQGAYASILSAIQGFKAAQKAAGSPPSSGSPTSFQGNIEAQLAAANPKFMMSGLTATDPETVQVKLASGCGWCLTAWTLEGAVGAIVDEKVIHAAGVDPVTWWQTPANLVGTGAYRLTAYTPKQSLTFSQVPNWWGSPKPRLKTINIDIKDPSTAPTTVDSFLQKGYDTIGYDGYSSIIPLANVLAVQSNSREKPYLLTQPKGRTTWLSFNIGYPSTGGPFLGESAAAKGLRLAFDLAVDKQGLATTVCHNLICSAATGGPITSGLIGNGGPNSDPLAKFNAGQARSLLHQYDPSGSQTKNLTYSYNAGSLNESVAEYLQSQWQTNLGVKVTLNSVSDVSIFISNRLSGKYEMSRDGWQFDYNHPQDWYDNLWGAIPTAEGANTSGFDDPTYDSILKQADAEPLTTALPLYNQLLSILQQDAAYLPLYYSVGNFLIQPYVKGAGTNTSFDHYWDEISILAH
jgi:ABC-type oligopeptide transport system substrate-binding subunit